MAGDFNFRIKWTRIEKDVSPLKINTPIEFKFVDTLEKTFLSQHIHSPTFQTNIASPTDTLDLIISETPTRIFDVILGPPLGKITKAHLTISFKVATKKPLKSLIFNSNMHNYFKGDYVGMSKFIDSSNWPDTSQHTIQDQYDYFMKIYGEAVDSFVPQGIINNKPRKPAWLNTEIKSKIRLKFCLWKQVLASNKSDNLVKDKYK